MRGLTKLLGLVESVHGYLFSKKHQKRQSEQTVSANAGPYPVPLGATKQQTKPPKIPGDQGILKYLKVPK